jgi:hypothetical protein
LDALLLNSTQAGQGYGDENREESAHSLGSCRHFSEQMNMDCVYAAKLRVLGTTFFGASGSNNALLFPA